MDCLAILNKWTDIGIYDVPIKYLYDPMEKLLSTPDLNESQNKHYDSPKNVTEILDDFKYIRSFE
jgi:hypothetical protein